MKKTVTRTKEVEVDEYFCDCCNMKVKNYHCSKNEYICSICHNIMCPDCRKNTPITNDQTSWTDAYNDPYYICKECEKIITPYAEKLNKLWIDYLNEKHETIKKLKKLRNVKEQK